MTEQKETTSVRQRLAAGEYLIGPFLKIPASVSAEITGYAGFDFCIIDLEHSPFTFERAEEMVRAAQAGGVASIIRTFDGRPSTLVRALDTGCDGILVPNIKSQSEVETVARAARFHPVGERGMDPYARSARYGTISKDVYFGRSNQRTLVGVQIEGLEAVERLQEILDVEGTDLVFVGPYDLSQSLGMPGQTTAEPVLAKVKEVAEAARARNKSVGIYADNVEQALRWRNLGIQFLAISVDVRLYWNACRAVVEAFHR